MMQLPGLQQLTLGISAFTLVARAATSSAIKGLLDVIRERLLSERPTVVRCTQTTMRHIEKVNKSISLLGSSNCSSEGREEIWSFFENWAIELPWPTKTVVIHYHHTNTCHKCEGFCNYATIATNIENGRVSSSDGVI
jgi:hypothetical protein